jgi:hypothetical protein
MLDSQCTLRDRPLHERFGVEDSLTGFLRGSQLRSVAGGIATAALLLAAARTGHAATVSGQVRDAERGQPLPFANVVLHAAGTDSLAVSRGAAADGAGIYRIESVPAGRYTLRFAYIAYRTRVDTVQVDTVDVRLDVALTPAPIGVEPVVVEADRLGREAAVQPGVIDIDMAQLERVPAIGEPDPIRALQFLPGVQAASDVSTGLYIRGGGPDQTLILFDDAPVYNPTHAFGFFSTFNPDVVDRVTLYKGAYPANQGGRLGAVVDIESRTPKEPDVSGTASISTIAARLTVEGPIGEHHWLVSGRRTYLEPILAALRANSPEIPYYNFYDVNAKFSTRRGRSWTDVTLYNGRDDLRIEPDPDTRLELEWGNTVATAIHTRMLSNAVVAKGSIAGSQYESTTDANFFNTPVTVTNRLRDLTARAELNLNTPAHALELGTQASAYDFEFDQSFNRGEHVGFESKPFEFAAYVDDQWAPNAVAMLRSGLRLRYITDGSRFYVEPRLSASYAVDEAVRIKFGAGLYNQYVQLIATEGFSGTDLYVPIDASAKPGRSVQTVLGVEWKASPTYELSAETYYTDLDHLVEFDSNVPADQEGFTADDLFVTDGTGYATGLELFAQRRRGRVTGWVGYGLGWSRRRFDTLNAGKSFPPKYDRRHDLKVVLDWKKSAWSYSVAFLFGTGQAFTPGSARYRLEDPALGDLSPGARLLPGERNSARLLPYHRMDFSVTREFRMFGRPAEWFVQFFNLYGRRNEWFVQFDDKKPDVEVAKMLPIIPSLGVKFNF